jgi:hypothetical protein
MSAGAMPEAGASPLDTRGLTLVVTDKPDVERDALAAAWADAGGHVLRLGRFWEPPPLEASRVRVYGADSYCQVLAQKLGLELISPDDDLVLRLPPRLLGRVVGASTLESAAALTYPVFLKTLVPKLIRSRVYASADELAAGARGLPDDTALMASEVVAFTAEVRCWVLEGEVLTLACYEGEADEPALEAARKLAAEAAGDAAVPSPCVLDLGFVAGRGWVVIEANAAWGAGLNGCDPAAAARCVARASRTAAPS